MAKFELTYKQYMDSIASELCCKLSDKCKITVTRNEFGYGGLKSVMKEYPEFDSLRLDWKDWHYMLDTKFVEKAYREEKSIDEFTNELVFQIKKEFVKLIMKEQE